MDLQAFPIVVPQTLEHPLQEDSQVSFRKIVHQLHETVVKTRGLLPSFLEKTLLVLFMALGSSADDSKDSSFPSPDAKAE